MDWVEITRLRQHWEKSTITATLAQDNTLKVETSSVEALTLRPPLADKPSTCSLEIDGQRISARLENGIIRLQRSGNGWQQPAPEAVDAQGYQK
jgi:hypothetical protein